MATERYCLECRGWYRPHERECPDCGTPRPAHNRWLVTAQLNSVLYRQIADAKRDA
jgi:hypothetical protein